MRLIIFPLMTALLFPAGLMAAQVPPKETPIRLAAKASYLKMVQDKSPAQSIKPEAEHESESKNPSLKNLSLNELLRQVVVRNQQVLIQRTEWGIKQAEEEKSHSIFEPEFVASSKLEENSQKNTVEESVNRLFESTYEERNWDHSLAVEGFAPTGAKYNLGYNLRKISNSLVKSLTDEKEEYQMYLGVSMTQPLLKNAWSKTTKAGIRTAEQESTAAFQDYRQRLMQMVKKAAINYWDYYQAQEKLKLRQDSIRIAEKLLVDNQERHRTGKMSETEVFEAMAGVASRKSLLSEARQDQLEGINNLRTTLSLEAADEELNLHAVDIPELNPPTIDKGASLVRALELQPESLVVQTRLKQADIKIDFAKNQRLPELDLIASYGLNGLDFNSSDSWQQISDAEYAAWAVGMEFRMPLLGGIDSRSELRKAELERRRQQMALRDIEIKLSNQIDTALNQVHSSLEQLNYANAIVELHKKLLDAELSRLNFGKSNSRLVLEKEDKYRNALEVALKNQVQLQTALIELEMAKGVILLNNGVEVMEGLL